MLFPSASNGSKIEVDGKVVGSRLIGQDFGGEPRYFQGRPSATEYSADVTYFNNSGRTIGNCRNSSPNSSRHT